MGYLQQFMMTSTLADIHLSRISTSLYIYPSHLSLTFYRLPREPMFADTPLTYIYPSHHSLSPDLS